MRSVIGVAGVATAAALVSAVLLFRADPVPTALAAQPQPAGDLPADLALVPTDAVGFIHVRAADIWRHETFAVIRQTFEKAGPKALAALDEQFIPKISTFDRLTAFLLLEGERMEPVPIIVLRFSAPFDTESILKTYLPNAEKVVIAGKTAYGSRDSDVAMHFPDAQHIVLGPSRGRGFETFLKHQSPKTGAMSYGLKLAASGKPVVGSVNLSAFPIPPNVLEGLPPEVRSLLKAEHLTGSVELGNGAKIEVTAGYKTADEAQNAERAVKALAEFARKELAKLKEDLEKKLFSEKGPRPAGDLPEALLMVFGLGALNSVDELLADPGAYIKRMGSNLTASVTIPKELFAVAGPMMPVAVGLLLPAVQKVREAAGRANSSNNLKQIAIACHNYHDAYGHFPQDITDKNGKPILSWRVAILPFMEQDALYKQFKLDEPWDSEHNKKWSQTAIKVYLSPNAVVPNPAGMTHYQGFVGPGTMFEPGKKIRFNDVTDGLSNTIMVVETADAVEWAKPGGIPFDPKQPLPQLRSVSGRDVILTALGDGSVRAVNIKSVAEKTLKAAITRNGGEVLGGDW